jgi:hypothetical protein
MRIPPCLSLAPVSDKRVPAPSAVFRFRCRCHLPLIPPTDPAVLAAAATGSPAGAAQAVCGQRIPGDGLTITNSPSGARYCVTGATPPKPDADPKGTS